MKNFRLLIIISLLGWFGGNLLQAQQDSKQKIRTLSTDERIELRIKSMSNRLMLDDKTSKSFVSIYKDYLKELHKSSSSLDKLLAKNEKKKKAYSNYSDKDIEKLLKEQLKLNEKRLKIHKKYYYKLKKVLTMRQVFEIFSPVFSSQKYGKETGPVPVRTPDGMKPGRIQDKDRLPVASKKEATPL